MMKNRERFIRTLNFQDVDRLPLIEWAGWWDKTIARWHAEGLPQNLTDPFAIRDYFGLDGHQQYWIRPRSPEFTVPEQHGAPVVTSREDYNRIKYFLYPEDPFEESTVRAWAERQHAGDLVVWITIDGFFWFPRVLLGIEPHLYAFHDQPDLMKEMNEDLLAFNIRVVEQFCDICTPDFITFAEDMSYNHGPMLSKSLFDEFMAPYYKRIVPDLLERGIIPFVDTDGDVTLPVSWFTEVGVRGFLPLERMAGVDVAKLREDNAQVRMIGAFDKTVMHLGEDRIRQEFERLLPVMRQGGFIPSVDHQTPPEVSLEQYRTYVRLLNEYANCVL